MSNSSFQEQKIHQKKNYRWLMQLAKSTRGWLLFSIALGMANGVLLIFQAGLLAFIIGQAAHSVSLISLKSPLLWLLLIIILRAVLTWWSEVVGCQSALRIKSELRRQLIRQLLNLHPIQAGQLDRGTMMSAVMEQVEALHNFFAFYLPQMSLAVFLPLMILVWVFPLNWVAGLILLLTAPLIPLFMALIGMGAETIHQKHFQSLSKLGAYFLNTLQGLTTLKLFGRSQQEAQTVYQVADEYRQRTMSVLKIAFLSSTILELFSSIAIAMVAVYLGLVLLGQIHFGAAEGISLEHALFILLLAPEFYLPLRRLATHYHAKAEAVAAASEMAKILALPTPETTMATSEPIRFDSVQLQCRDVNFHYDRSPQLLDKINLTVNAGECIAIEGPSGIGKSTLIQLIMGLLQPTTGNILVNGVDLKQMDTDAWMQTLAWIGQRTRLFPGTIRSNLLIADPKASQSELLDVLRFAHLDTFIQQLPQGLDTAIGEDNAGLSGGQVQRIALARAYLKKAPLLLLDEPTASLDQHSEQVILNGLRKLKKNKTVVIVSHRAATLRLADRIYYLKNNRLQASQLNHHRVTGAHDE